jgi:hypothetical protein
MRDTGMREREEWRVTPKVLARATERMQLPYSELGEDQVCRGVGVGVGGGWPVWSSVWELSSHRFSVRQSRGGGGS